ncbi:hypothetical protein HDU99_006356, partial [Rhizoclosmatium hyalinum]
MFSPLIWDLSLGKSQPRVSVAAHVLSNKLLNVNEAIDDESILIVNSDFLLEVGVTNGVFVQVMNESDSSKSRLCRIHVSDSHSSDAISCFLPPVSYFNLGLSAESNKVIIQRISADMKESQIPHANQLNIARVSGPFTNHKKYLDLCLDALGD